MFTVLHRHDDGSETIYEAASVTRFCPEGTEPEQPILGNLILRGVPESAVIGPGASRDNQGNIQLRYGCRSSGGRPPPAAFVMNDKGATVATYCL